MEFLEQIEKLQKKPEASKIKILIATVFIVMAVIILVWIQTMRYGFSKENKSQGEQYPKISEPLKLLWGIAGESAKNLKDRLQKLKP
ncbi:MAG: hypothetical protein AAB474_02615 [Patescibacteria group bacterium]